MQMRGGYAVWAMLVLGCSTEDPVQVVEDDAAAADVVTPGPMGDGGSVAQDVGVDAGRDSGAVAVDAGSTVRDVPVVMGDAGVSPTLGGCPLFPPDNLWNRDVSADALHPQSAQIMANIQAHGDNRMLRADFGRNPAYGLPYVIVPESQARVPITYTEYGDESDPGPFPIPLNAPIEGGNDDHVLVLQQGACRLFELYHARRAGSGWAAGSGATFDLRSNRLRPEGWTSTDQAGLAVLPGLIRYDEIQAGVIRHAIRVTFDHTQDAWVHPATHPGGNRDSTAPPMGLRLRLRASYNIAAFRGSARVILEALKRYGLMVADTGYNWYMSGATDTRWNDTELETLRQVPGSAFEVVNTGPFRRR